MGNLDLSKKLILAKVLKKLKNPMMFLDMDGVIADFNNGFKGKKPESVSKMWKIVEKEGEDFWKDLKLFPGAKTLWNYVKDYDPIILSAHPYNRGEKMTKDAIEGKRWWLAKHFGKAVAEKAIIKTRGDKKNYAHSNAILIDDIKKNIVEFESAGGTGILYTGAAAAIKELKDLGL